MLSSDFLARQLDCSTIDDPLYWFYLPTDALDIQHEVIFVDIYEVITIIIGNNILFGTGFEFDRMTEEDQRWMLRNQLRILSNSRNSELHRVFRAKLQSQRLVVVADIQRQSYQPNIFKQMSS